MLFRSVSQSRYGCDGVVKQLKAKCQVMAEAKYMVGVEKAVRWYGFMVVVKYYWLVVVGEFKGMDIVLTQVLVVFMMNMNVNVVVLNLIQPGMGFWNCVG